MKLKWNLKDNRKEALKFITVCFDDILEENGFITWLPNGTGCKPNRLKQTLKENKPNEQNSKFTAANFQEIHDFWLDNCINSNESAYNMKRITKRSFLEQFSNITDSNVTEKKVQLKKGPKVVFTAPKMVYTESVRKLHSGFNQKAYKCFFVTLLQVQALPLCQTDGKRKVKLSMPQLPSERRTF